MWSLAPEGRKTLVQDVSPGKRCGVDEKPRRGARILELGCTAPDGAMRPRCAASQTLNTYHP